MNILSIYFLLALFYISLIALSDNCQEQLSHEFQYIARNFLCVMFKLIPSLLIINDSNPIFKYNSNAKYLTKSLRGGYSENNVLLLDIYINSKGLSAKSKLLNT